MLFWYFLQWRQEGLKREDCVCVLEKLYNAGNGLGVHAQQTETGLCAGCCPRTLLEKPHAVLLR